MTDKLWEEKAQHFIHGYLGHPGPAATPGQSYLTIDVAALWIPYVRKGLAKLATECLLRGKAKVRSNILTDKHFQFSPLEDEMCCQKNVTDNPSADVKNCSELSVFLRILERRELHIPYRCTAVGSKEDRPWDGPNPENRQVF